MNRYQKLFKNLQEKNEGAFVPFVVLGDPTLKTSLKIIDTLIESGADALEIGLPFSDPVADGQAVQQADIRALKQKPKWSDWFSLLKQVRQKNSETPIGLLVYANLIVNFGIDKFYQEMSLASVDSVLVADVPTLEVRPFRLAAKRANVDCVMIVPPNATEEKIKTIAKLSSGYTYVVTRSGVTGADNDFKYNSASQLKALKKFGAPPPIFGFGISKPEHVSRALSKGGAGAISGSAIAKIIEKNFKKEKQMLKKIANFCRSMKKAAK